METIVVACLALAGGVLLDHLVLNKIAGLIQPEVAAAQVAAAEAKAVASGVVSHVESLVAALRSAPQVIHVNVPPVAPAPPAPPAPPATGG